LLAPAVFVDETDFRESVLLFVRRPPLSAATPIHCLSIRALRKRAGQIDSQELEVFLDQTAGPNAWLMISVWLFARAPEPAPPGLQCVPVICPEPAAARLNLADCEDHRTQRVYGEHIVGAVELQGWRWMAAQVYPQSGGQFPWEFEARALQNA
jgi:hypothetical protein